jgi:hypothetical protein
MVFNHDGALLGAASLPSAASSSPSVAGGGGSGGGGGGGGVEGASEGEEKGEGDVDELLPTKEGTREAQVRDRFGVLGVGGV